MAPADLLKTVVAVLFLLGPVTGVTGAVPARQCAGRLHRTHRLERRLEAAQRSRPTIERLGGFSEIRLAAVTYRHGNDDIGFTVGPLDLAVRAGEVLFISGANGSGKSTLRRLRTALYAPQEGVLLVDGRPVDDDHREAYQGLFSTVFADFHVFERTFGLGDVAPALVEEWLEGELAGTRLVDGRFTRLRDDRPAQATGAGRGCPEDRPPCSTSSPPTRRQLPAQVLRRILPLLHKRGRPDRRHPRRAVFRRATRMHDGGRAMDTRGRPTRRLKRFALV